MGQTWVHPRADQPSHFPFHPGNVETGPNCEVSSARNFACIDVLPSVGRVIFLTLCIGKQPPDSSLPGEREESQSRITVHAVARSAQLVYTRCILPPATRLLCQRDRKCQSRRKRPPDAPSRIAPGLGPRFSSYPGGRQPVKRVAMTTALTNVSLLTFPPLDQSGIAN